MPNCAESRANIGERQKSIRVIGVDQNAPASVVADSQPQPAPAAPTISEAKNESAAATRALRAPVIAPNDVALPSAQTGLALSPAVTLAQPPAAEFTLSASPPIAEIVRVPAHELRMRAKTEANIPAKAAGARRDKVRRETAERANQPHRVTTLKPEREEVADHAPDRRDNADRRSRREDADGQSRRADVEDRNEAEGFSLMRRHVLPDGRRVTVYRRYESDGSAPRRPQSPFGSLFGDGDVD
jgi:hypothetical protein